MHMDASFVGVQEIGIHEIPSWSNSRPELKWSSLVFEVINAPGSEPSLDSEQLCGYEESLPEVSERPFETNPLRLGTPGRSTPKAHVRSRKGPKQWPNPNISAEPVYSDESNNLFLKLQKRPLQNKTFDARNEIVINKSLPPPDDMYVHANDSNQLSFFLREVPQFMGCICCLPQMIDIFTESVNQPILRHSILALSSAIQQAQGGLASLYVSRNVQYIIPQIQQAISEVKINTSHMVSVTFLAWLALTTCDFRTAHRHIRGLLSMLKVTQHISPSAQYTAQDPHPLAMFLFCMAVKADNYLASRNQPFAIPPIQYNENYHRQWLKTIATSEMHLEYCLATVQLDVLANNIGHLQRQATQLRLSGFPDAEGEIRRRMAPLRLVHKSWLSRPYIHHHIRNIDLPENPYPDSPGSPSPSRFLSYPEYIIFDPLVAYMHMNHASLAIHMNFILSGHINDDESYEAAVLICRIFAALNSALGGNAGKTLHGCLTALWFAGMVFADNGNHFLNAFQWIIQALLEIDKESRFKAARRVSDALLEIRCTQGDPWEIIGQEFSTKKKKASDSIELESSRSSSGSGV